MDVVIRAVVEVFAEVILEGLLRTRFGWVVLAAAVTFFLWLAWTWAQSPPTP